MGAYVNDAPDGDVQFFQFFEVHPDIWFLAGEAGQVAFIYCQKVSVFEVLKAVIELGDLFETVTDHAEQMIA